MSLKASLSSAALLISGVVANGPAEGADEAVFCGSLLPSEYNKDFSKAMLERERSAMRVREPFGDATFKKDDCMIVAGTMPGGDQALQNQGGILVHEVGKTTILYLQPRG
jgi:hypothetical protein